MRSGNWIKATVYAVAALLLTGCQNYSYYGPYPNDIPFHPITISESKVSFVGDSPVKLREARTLPGRYSERIRLYNDFALYYDQSTEDGFGDSSDDVIKRSIDATNIYRKNGLVFDRKMLKNGSYYTYYAQSTPTDSCFVVSGIFGDRSKGRSGNRGNQAVWGSACYPVYAKSVDDLVREVTDVLARARFDDGVANRNGLAKPDAATAKEPATLDVSKFVRCYTNLIDAIYRAPECQGVARMIDETEAERIYRRFAQERSAAESGGVSFTPAPAGTTVYVGNVVQSRIVAADDMVVTTINEIGRLSYSIGFFAPMTLMSRSDARAAESIWPLAVGKETKFVAVDRKDTIEVNLKVIRREMLTIPAGTFDTFVVERHLRGGRVGSAEKTTTYWYAPSVGDVVKIGAATEREMTTPESWEATRIVRAGGN